MNKEESNQPLLALLKAMHDGVAQKVAEQVMQGDSDPWVLHVGAVHADEDGSARILTQDESKPAIRTALATLPDGEGVEVLENIFLRDPLISSKLQADIGAGSRFLIYGRRAVVGAVHCVCVDIRSNFFNTKTEHPISSYQGMDSVELQPFPIDLALDIGTLVFPSDGRAPMFINAKKDGS